MSIKKLESGKWQADIRPDGKTRKRKSFRTKAEAQRWINQINTQALSEKDWNKSRKDQRTLSEYAKLWYDLHGRNLKDQTRYPVLLNICMQLQDPIAQEMDAKAF